MFRHKHGWCSQSLANLNRQASQWAAPLCSVRGTSWWWPPYPRSSGAAEVEDPQGTPTTLQLSDSGGRIISARLRLSHFLSAEQWEEGESVKRARNRGGSPSHFIGEGSAPKGWPASLCVPPHLPSLCGWKLHSHPLKPHSSKWTLHSIKCNLSLNKNHFHFLFQYLVITLIDKHWHIPLHYSNITPKTISSIYRKTILVLLKIIPVLCNISSGVSYHSNALMNLKHITLQFMNNMDMIATLL
jgi:hypothetical protein